MNPQDIRIERRGEAGEARHRRQRGDDDGATGRGERPRRARRRILGVAVDKEYVVVDGDVLLFKFNV